MNTQHNKETTLKQNETKTKGKKRQSAKLLEIYFFRRRLLQTNIDLYME